MLADLEEAEAEVSAVTRKPAGLLRVTVPTSFGVLHLARLLPAYRARYPEVLLGVSATDRKVDLVDEAFDLAVRLSSEYHPTYVDG